MGTRERMLMLPSKWHNGRQGGEAGRLLRELSVEGYVEGYQANQMG